jgi:hypothetical protein
MKQLSEADNIGHSIFGNPHVFYRDAVILRLTFVKGFQSRAWTQGQTTRNVVWALGKLFCFCFKVASY